MFLLGPNAGVVLVAAGMAAILLEFVRPGWVVPAVSGCLMVVFGIHALLQYRLEPTGLVLVLTGFVLCGLEARLQARGLLGIVAGASLFVGTLRLVSDEPIQVVTALATSLPLAALMSILLTLAWRARRNKRTTIF